MTDAPIVLDDLTGTQRLLGYRVLVYPDRAEVVLDMDERHHNRWSTLHGGIVATMLDTACGFAASRHYSDDATAAVVTLSTTVNFIAAPRGGRVTATGRITRAGRSTAFVEGQLADADGRLMATASAIFKRAGTRRGDRPDG